MSLLGRVRVGRLRNLLELRNMKLEDKATQTDILWLHPQSIHLLQDTSCRNRCTRPAMLHTHLGETELSCGLQV